MKYMLFLYLNESWYQGRSQAEKDERLGAYMAYAEALQKAGVAVATDRLQPTTHATTVRISNGKTQVLNGPYAESQEQLGGYFVIDVPDLDAALAWAARCPTASHGIVEVRPFWPHA